MGAVAFAGYLILGAVALYILAHVVAVIWAVLTAWLEAK